MFNKIWNFRCTTWFKILTFMTSVLHMQHYNQLVLMKTNLSIGFWEWTSNKQSLLNILSTQNAKTGLKKILDTWTKIFTKESWWTCCWWLTMRQNLLILELNGKRSSPLQFWIGLWWTRCWMTWTSSWTASYKLTSFSYALTFFLNGKQFFTNYVPMQTLVVMLLQYLRWLTATY